MSSPSHVDVRDCVCLNARRAVRHLTQVYDEALRPSGLRVTQFQLLAAVAEAQPVTQQVLSGILGMDRTTLTRNLALLEREGLIDIEIGQQDRREHVHRTTATGRKALAKAMPLWRAVHANLLAHVSSEHNGATLQQTQAVLQSLGSFSD